MKIISVVLILVLLNSLVACYSTRHITHKDEIREVLNTGEDITIETNGSGNCNLTGENYRLENDTLYGHGRFQSGYQNISSKKVEVALDEIHVLTIKEFSKGRTILFVPVIVGLGVFFYYYIVVLPNTGFI